MLPDRDTPLARLREWLRAALVALGLVALNAAVVANALGFVHKPRRVLETDHYYYLAMAERAGAGGSSDQARTAPYCWRVLTPALAAQLTRLGFSLDQAFYLLTNVFLCGFLLAVVAYLRVVGCSERESWLGVALVGLMQGAVRWYEYQYWMSDPLALFLVCSGLLLAELGRERALGAVCVLGVLARESVLLALVYYGVRWLKRAGLRRALIRTVALSAAPLATLMLLRVWITPIPGPRLVRVLQEILRVRVDLLFTNQLYLATVGTFGVLLPLACASPRRLWAHLKNEQQAAAIVAAAYLSLLFGNNTDRLLAYASPVVASLALLGLRALAAGSVSRWWAWAIPALGLQVFFWLSTPFHLPAVSVYQSTSWPVVIALVSFWALALWQARGAPTSIAAATAGTR
jgi:hypothetical protein